MVPGLHRFRPLALPLGDEESVLERAVERLHELEEGDIAVLPELVAWTEDRSEIAYAALVGVAQEHGLGVVTTLNLPAELTEDLPGREPDARYNAVVLITRFGHVHVPQAKVTPQPFERDRAMGGPGIGVAAYRRVNRVRLDLGDEVVEARFLVCSDLWLLRRLPAKTLACDLLVTPANFAHGAEAHAREVLARARAGGVAHTTVLVNSFQQPQAGRAPLAVEVEEVLEADEERPRAALDRKAIAGAFRVYDDARAPTFAAMADLPEREGRIAVPRSLAEAEVEAGDYRVTVVF